MTSIRVAHSLTPSEMGLKPKIIYSHNIYTPNVWRVPSISTFFVDDDDDKNFRRRKLIYFHQMRIDLRQTRPKWWAAHFTRVVWPEFHRRKCFHFGNICLLSSRWTASRSGQAPGRALKLRVWISAVSKCSFPLLQRKSVKAANVLNVGLVVQKRVFWLL